VLVAVGSFKAAHHPYPYYDDPDFLDLGNQIRAAGGPLGLLRDLFAGRFTEANRHPLYLALVAVFARPDVRYHRDAQALSVALEVLAVLSCWWAARRHLGRGAAALLVVLFAGSGALAWTASRECSDTLLVAFWAQAVSSILDGALDRPFYAGPGARSDDAYARRAWLRAGVWSGLAYLAKGPGLFLPICLGLTLLLRDGLRPLREVRTWLFGGAFVLVSSPLWWRNLRVYGSPFYHDNGRLLWIDRLPDYAETFAPYANARLPHGIIEYWARATPRSIGWRVGMSVAETAFNLGDAMALVAPVEGGVLHVTWAVLGGVAAGAALRLVWRAERGFTRTFMLVHAAWWIAFLTFFDAAGGAARYFLPLVTTTLAPALALRCAKDLARAPSPLRARWVSGIGAASLLAVATTFALDPSPTRPPPGYLEVQDWLVHHLHEGDVYAVDARTHLRPSWVIPQARQLIVSASWQVKPLPAEEIVAYLCDKNARYVVLDAASWTKTVEGGASRARYLFYDVLKLEPDGSLPLQGFPGGMRPVYVGAESPRRWVVLETSCPGELRRSAAVGDRGWEAP
jgi:4-amino-4-deoxy-L-arabinose transferase-like glycosyltransferase